MLDKGGRISGSCDVFVPVVGKITKMLGISDSSLCAVELSKAFFLISVELHSFSENM